MESKIEVNKKVQSEILKKSLIISILIMFLSIAGIVAYIVYTLMYGTSITLILTLVLACLVFVIALCNLLILKSVIKQIDKNSFVNEYDFEDDTIIVSSHKLNGIIIAEGSVPYDTVLKVKETKNYLLIYISKGNVWPVEKSTLSVEDLRYLRHKFILQNKLKARR